MPIAIDFGTSNTVVARWNAATQQAETLTIPGLSVQWGDNPPVIPSLVYVENAAEGKVLVGQQVRDRGLDLGHDPRFFRNFKRGIGASIQGFLPELDGVAVTFEQVGQWFLQAVSHQLQAIGASDPTEPIVFTVPVDSFESYRHWLGQVALSLQADQVRLLDEPTAAALGYGRANQGLLLVIDFGGGTLDFSLVRLDTAQQPRSQPLGFLLKLGQKSLTDSKQRPKLARVLAKAGQNLGGADIDEWLVDYFAATQGLAKTPLTTRLAERLKIQLSHQAQATEAYFNDETFETFELSLDQPGFAAILADHQFFDRLDESMQQVLQQSRRQGIEAAEIGAVLVVGGTAQIPAVQAWVQHYFEPTQLCSAKPFEAIAQGALQITQGIELQDFLYHSYGIRYWNRRQNGHDWHPLIKAGQAYPMDKPLELVLGASVQNQPSIELVVGELGTEDSGTEVYFESDRLITRSRTGVQVQPLNEKARSIAQLIPPGSPGTDRIRVLFQVDAQRFLRMTVEDLLTGQTLLDNQVVVQLS